MSRIRRKFPHGPDADNRVLIYALSGKPERMIELLYRLALGRDYKDPDYPNYVELPLTPQEKQTLCDWWAGEFRYRRGESFRRDLQAEATEAAVEWYGQFRNEEPGQSEDETIREVRAKLGSDAPSFETIKNAIHRRRKQPSNI